MYRRKSSLTGKVYLVKKKILGDKNRPHLNLGGPGCQTVAQPFQNKIFGILCIYAYLSCVTSSE